MGCSVKDKNGIKTSKTFQEVLDESNHKPNKIWVDKSSEFYNRSMKSRLKDNYILMYLTHNEGESVVAKRLIRTLKNKIYKYMTSVSKMCMLTEKTYLTNKKIYIIAQSQ